MLTYLSLFRNEKIKASEIVPGSNIFFHINIWNGSYERKIVSVQVNDNSFTWTDAAGYRHTIPSDTPVWIREYEQKEGLNVFFVVSIFNDRISGWSQFKTQDINKLNDFMKKQMSYDSFNFHLEAIQKNVVIAGHKDIVDNWKPQRYHWFEDGYSNKVF